ncbi:hypothetical protein ACFFX1_01185 [Dactylosporangium sucinum]|uniref:Uncharacterized protein n=1 Tax=Dactylosporangium sucinum TaxID=1424081 RepID=A0A917T4Y7_9ACTN|nr:hypothetical protein [Dactylosporangium sucinum]GGM09641.1 hypothetical protein GCM10007977_008460 [Dactylosporangium sucinum]
MSGTAVRTAGVRVAAVVFALTWLVYPGFGVPDLAVTWDPAWAVALEAGWGLLFTVLVAAAFARVAVRPRRSAPAVVQLLCVAAALAVSAAASLEWALLLVALAVAGEALVVAFAPGREPLTTGGVRVDRPLAVLAGLGALPWLAYANAMYAANRLGLPEDISIGIDHYAVQGAVGLALVVLSWTAACRPRLRRFAGVGVGLVAAYLGLVCLAFPGTPGGFGPVWSALSMAWGIAFGTLAAVRGAGPGADPC